MNNKKLLSICISAVAMTSGALCFPSFAETTVSETTSNDTAVNSASSEIAIPDEGLVEGKPSLLGTTMISLDSLGYKQSEYFIKGTASSYHHTGPVSSDGKWAVETEDEADFKTRIVVYQPKDPAKFNGTVIFEWFNVSGGTEASSSWIMAHTELVRSGYAWVGVSAQKGGIEGEGVKVLNISLPLKTVKPKRYNTLTHPGDEFSYDIFRQAAKSVIQPQNFKPLGDLQIERAIALGESQSADHLLTYINALAPQEKVFDGYLIHSRVHGSKPLSPEAKGEAENVNFETRDTVKVRDDIDVPVMLVQTETDMTVLGAYPDSQPDTDLIRTWEIAGTAHADRYVGNLGLTDRGNRSKVADVVETNYAIPLLIKCDIPINSGPQHFVVKAAISSMNKWLETGVAPTPADRFVYDETTSELKRDHFGNVLGGIRTPYVDVPIAMLSGEGQPGSLGKGDSENGFCSIYGTTKLFDETTLGSLYPSHRHYVNAVKKSVDAAVSNGFLVEADGKLIKASARKSSVGRSPKKTSTKNQ